MVAPASFPFGDLLRRHRLAAGLTQEELAERANLSVRAISDLERGAKHAPHRHTVQLLVQALHLLPEEQAALERTIGRRRGPANSPRSGTFPPQPTPFIGRRQEVEEVTRLLALPEVRLLTLTGPGGAGKTRLAIRVAEEVQDSFADGVVFVPLASVAAPEFVPAVIATSLAISRTSGDSMLDNLTGYLREKHMLLVLDSFEHLLPAATVVSHLLTGCDHVKIQLTSRAILQLAAEHDYPVPPLAMPTPRHLPELEALSRYDAIQLFLQRARAASPTLQLTNENAPCIVDICHQLDGLPLAIELAAARIRLFPPRELLGHLSDRLHLLTGGPKDAPLRQQTLRSTIDWSYDLLGQDDRTLFARLGVFAGGCTFEAAKAICALDRDLDMLEGMTSLLDQSLLVSQGTEESRFAMLETVREYAAEKLEERAETQEIRAAHARYFLGLAEESETELEGPGQARRLEQLEREHDNLLAALQWALGAAAVGAEEERRELALRLGGSLWLFWYLHAHLQEGQTFLRRAISSGAGAMPLARAKALRGAAILTLVGGEPEAAATLAEEGLALFREVGDSAGIGFCLFPLGVSATYRGEYTQARVRLEESVARLRDGGSTYQLGLSLRALGVVDFAQGDVEPALTRYQEAFVLFRELDNTEAMASTLFQMGLIHFYVQEDAARAHACFEEACALLREVGHIGAVAVSLIRLAEVALLGQGNLFAARRLGNEALALFSDIGYQGGIAEALFVEARVEARQGNMSVARRLYDDLLIQAFEPDTSRKLQLPVPYRLHFRSFIPRQFDDTVNLPFYVEGMAEVVAAQGEAVWAARLWGTAEFLRETLPSPRPPVFEPDHERAVVAARTEVGETIFAAAWAQGRDMTVAQVLGPQGREILAQNPQGREDSESDPADQSL